MFNNNIWSQARTTLKNAYNLSKFLLSVDFRKEVLQANLTFVLCRNGKTEYVIHNLEAFIKNIRLSRLW